MAKLSPFQKQMRYLTRTLDCSESLVASMLESTVSGLEFSRAHRVEALKRYVHALAHAGVPRNLLTNAISDFREDDGDLGYQSLLGLINNHGTPAQIGKQLEWLIPIYSPRYRK